MNKNDKQFVSSFDKDAKEFLVLTETDGSCSRSRGYTMWQRYQPIMAAIDLQTNTLTQGEMSLVWLISETDLQAKNYGWNFEKESIYHIKAKKSLNHVPHLYVVEVLEENCSNPQLEEILAEYQTLVVIHPQNCSELVLDKYLKLFTGTCQWNGESCQLCLSADHDSCNTAENANQTLELLLAQSEEWDKKARQYAGQKLASIATDWLQDMEYDDDYDEDEDEDDEDETQEHIITKEEFASRLSISELAVEADGFFEFYYDDDDMFMGHVVIVSGNIETGFTDAYFAG